MEEEHIKESKKKKANPGKVILTLFIIVAVILAGLFVFHRVKHGIDMKYLSEKGYYNPVSIGDLSINVVKVGNLDDWYEFRDNCYRDRAERWCTVHNFELEE